VPYHVEAAARRSSCPKSESTSSGSISLAGTSAGRRRGFRDLRQIPFGATEFEQRIALRRALEGELARTIASVGAVQAARVHLVLPERSIFAINKEFASASVVLRLRRGERSESPKSRASYTWSRAVPGLNEDHVSI